MLNQLKAHLRFLQNGWNNFWFRSPAPAQMRLIRVFAGSIIFFSTLTRTPDLKFFFTDDGLVKQSILSELADTQFRHSIFEIFPSFTAVWVCHILLLIALALLILGVWPRLAAFVALVLHVSFMHRNVMIAYGVEIIATYYLFYFCFADYRDRASQDTRRILGSVSYRLCQIQICLIYGFAGLDKVRGPSWWRGDALWMVLSNSTRTTMDFAWLGHFPAVIAFMTYLTLFWETYFPVLVWFKPVGRWLSIGLGVMIHVGICLSMGLFSFSFLMISTYSVFLGEDVAGKIAQCVKKMTTPRKVFLQKADQFSV